MVTVGQGSWHQAVTTSVPSGRPAGRDKVAVPWYVLLPWVLCFAIIDILYDDHSRLFGWKGRMFEKFGFLRASFASKQGRCGTGLVFFLQ